MFSIRDVGMLTLLDMVIEELAKKSDACTISLDLADKFHGMNLHTRPRIQMYLERGREREQKRGKKRVRDE
jgi:hypothetical protein